MQTISFSEQAFDTINPVYLCKVNTVSFSGQIVSDTDNPTSPVLSFDQQFIGPVSWTFSDPVSHVEFDAGVFNQVGSTTVNFYNKNGALLKSVTNTVTGLQHFVYDHAGIAKVEVINTGTDDSGFAIDNVSFVNQPPKVVASGNQDIDGLIWGYKWDHTNLSYSFPTSSAEYLTNGYKEIDGFQSLTAHQIAMYQQIIGLYGSVCSLTFTQTAAPNADLRFAQATQIDYSDGRGLHAPGNDPGTAEANPCDPGRATVAWGDTWFSLNPAGNDNGDPEPGNFIYAAAFMHELGHELGLKHGQTSQNGHGYTFPTLPADHDSQEYSIMTYDTYPGAQGNTDDYPTTLMQDDIATLQYIYGANYHSNAGATVYSWSPTTGEEFINGAGQGANVHDKIFMTVWDGGGTDTYNFTNYTTRLSIDLRPGDWSITDPNQLAYLGDNHFARGNIANALLYQGNTASEIENANGGTANDRIVGNDVNNVLRGGAGADTLYGLDGNDTLIGGAGADTMTGGNGHDTFAYTAVSQSTGTACDDVRGFDARFDHFQLWYALSGVDAAVTTGALSTGDFNDDLAAAIGAAKLAAHDAVCFTPSAGTLKGATFLIIDANGVAGFQAHDDLVILLDKPVDLAALNTANFV
jgi:Ca2+-binding RTX toxin-like protein